MRIYPLAKQCGPHRYNKISTHTLPDEVESILFSPDVRASASDIVDLLLNIIITGTRVMDCPNICLALKLTQSIIML